MHMHLLSGSSIISFENCSYNVFHNSAVQISRPVYIERKIKHAIVAYSEDWIQGAHDPCS